MSSIINKGSQSITFDFKQPAKGQEFNKLTRDIIKPGVYKGLSINFAGNTVSVLPGKAVINCSYNNQDILAVKCDFETLYTFSEQIFPSVTGSNEIFWLEYEYAEVTENFLDFKHLPSDQYFLNPVSNAIILGEVIFSGNTIVGVSYSNKTWGLTSASNDYSIPDSQYYFNTTSPSKKWKTTGTLLTGTKELQYQFFNESTGRIVTTSPTNTSIIENKLSIASVEDATSPTSGAFTTLGGIGVAKSVVVGQNVAVSGNITVANRIIIQSFFGRVPLGGVIPVIGAFSLTGNGGTFTAASLPVSGAITSDGFQRCDGSLINNSESVFNGRYTPSITDDRFIQGSTSAGSFGGGGNNANNTHTISTSNLPTHTHDISHTHGATTGTESSDHSHTGYTDTTGAHSHIYTPYGISVSFNAGGAGNWRFAYSNNGDGVATGTDVQGSHAHNIQTYGRSAAHTHSLTTSSQSTTTSGNGGFANTPIDIRPKYINAVYLIRVL